MQALTITSTITAPQTLTRFDAPSVLRYVLMRTRCASMPNFASFLSTYVLNTTCDCLLGGNSLMLFQGLYSPIRAGSCLECERGTYAAGSQNSTTKKNLLEGSDQCTTCPGGHFTPHNNMSTCGQCGAGRYAAARSRKCFSCKVGFVAPYKASVTCAACPPGKVAPEIESLNCTACKSGMNLSLCRVNLTLL
jgi:hypothetical protein